MIYKLWEWNITKNVIILSNIVEGKQLLYHSNKCKNSLIMYVTGVENDWLWGPERRIIYQSHKGFPYYSKEAAKHLPDPLVDKYMNIIWNRNNELIFDHALYRFIILCTVSMI